MNTPDDDIVNNYINGNFDDIIDNLDTDDFINDDIENYKNIISDYKDEIEEYNEQNKINDDISKREKEEEDYTKLLINTYMKHYNDSHNKNDTFLSNIEDDNTPNSQMEILYSLKYEFENIREKIGLLNNIECMEYMLLTCRF